jgi:Zn-finger nucleic acid-binding protein
MLAESVSQVAVDRCPVCRGVWLDAGELEVIVGAAANLASTRPDRTSDFLAELLMEVAGSPKKKK